MTSKLTARPLRGPGQLVIDPVLTGRKLSGNYPDYGGVVIGYVRQAVLVSSGSPLRVEYESLGEAGDVLEANHRYVLAAFLRGWDDDAVRLLLTGGHETGETTGHAVFHAPGTRTPGQSALDRARRVLLVPDDREHAPAALLYRGIPDWSDAAELAFSRRDELGIPIAIEALRDAEGDILRVGRVDDL
jgi:hypothetical protein